MQAACQGARTKDQPKLVGLAHRADRVRHVVNAAIAAVRLSHVVQNSDDAIDFTLPERLGVSTLMLLAVLLACPFHAQAGPTPSKTTPLADRDYHGGLNLRTDFGTHPLRVDFGIHWSTFDAWLAMDPMVFIDGQHDTDLVLSRAIGNRMWSIFGGARSTSVAIAQTTHWQHKTLLGVGARLPPLFGDSYRAHWGLEMSTLIAKHGGSSATESIFSSSGRDFVDLINFGMFVRFEYARPF